ncbi:MAG TPA: phosphate/phosphite/phosphonate ABC transporter substrate-binding protein [Thiobacillus sp.]|nr:phosphate/phosphite/phosphonate ABC transporter substrate-binding protein [Thiobacillus sp.]
MRSLARWRGFPRHILHALTDAAGNKPLASLHSPRTIQLRRTLKFRLVALPGVLLLLAMGIPTAFSADKPLTFGVFPHLTAKQIVETYRPLADVLEKHMRRRVAIYTARDFKTFVERTRQGEYDILLTAPHLAWLARQDAGYRPLLKYAQPVRGLLVVKADSPFHAPDALRGHTIATADSIAVAVLAIHAELAAHGLRRNIDYQTTDSGTHLNAVMQVINGRADAAMLGLPTYRLMPPELRQQLRVLAETPPLSSLMYLTHPRLRDAEAQAVRKTLLSFAATPEGQAFMQHGGYGGFTDVDGNELSAFRPYALQAQEMLRAPQ